MPESVSEAYGGEDLRFGPTYLIPKPFDHRVLLWVAPAVAQAAVDDGVAGVEDFDLEAYTRSLEQYLGGARQVMAAVEDRARRAGARVALSEGEEPRVLRAAAQMLERGMARPVLLGNRTAIEAGADALGISLDGMEVVDPSQDTRREELSRKFYDLRSRRGVNLRDADQLIKNPRRYALLLLERGDVDCAVTGVKSLVPGLRARCLRGRRHPGRQARGGRAHHGAEGPDAVPGGHVASHRSVRACAGRHRDGRRRHGARVRLPAPVSRCSRSATSAASRTRTPRRSSVATRLVRKERPDIIVDGEMHVDVAVARAVGNRLYPDSLIDGDANVLVFPNLASGNMGYKLLEHLAGAEAIGPVLVGMNKPVVVSYQTASVQTLVT